MRRIMFILIWVIAFIVTPAFLCGGIIAVFYLPQDPDPPTEMAFMGTMCLSPIAGILGLVLGVRGKLPGTGKQD
jgi:hypothetical protein